MDEIIINPIGQVCSDTDDPSQMPLGGKAAVVEVYPPYVEALQGIEENSHIWVLAWFHKADRTLLKTVPMKVNHDLPEYGVFGLRSFNRPNPVGMCLARLEKVEGNRLYVSGLDAIGGTPVIDIKPYYENDTIFSPGTPYIKGRNRGMRQAFILKHALVHHQEDCRDLRLAVRMASIAEEALGKLNEDDLFVEVQGSTCLADCIQGITRARFSNPPRFSFSYSASIAKTVWKKGKTILSITAKSDSNYESLVNLLDEDLFVIEEL